MMKLTVRYPTEAEFLRFLHIIGPFIKKCKPSLSKPATRSSETECYKRVVWLDNIPTKQ